MAASTMVDAHFGQGAVDCVASVTVACIDSPARCVC
jgi:hypothetical protein